MQLGFRRTADEFGVPFRGGVSRLARFQELEKRYKVFFCISTFLMLSRTSAASISPKLRFFLLNLVRVLSNFSRILLSF